MRLAITTALLPGRRTLRARWLAVGLMLGTAVALAQMPAASTPPVAADPAAAADAALVAHASTLVLKREIARLHTAEMLETDPEAMRRVRRAGSALVGNASAINPAAAHWAWGITGESRDEPMAWCLPNGAMMVSYGLMKRLSLTHAELAAILAHVIGHQLAGADAKAALAAYRRQHETPDPDVNRAAGELADILGKLILSPRYDAAAEKQADALGLELLARSGINPKAAVSAWRKVAQSESTRPPGLVALHPIPPERIADLEAQAAAVTPLYDQALADAAAARKPTPKAKSKSPQRRGPRSPDN